MAVKVSCGFRCCQDRSCPCTRHPWSWCERLARGRAPFDLAGWTWSWKDTFFLLQIAALWIAVAVALGGCASAPPASPLPALPPPVNLGHLVQPAPGPLVVPPHVPRYPDTLVRRGQCPGLPPGILVSPAVYAEATATAQDAKRLRVEVAALEDARRSDRAAAELLEQACRARVAELAAAVDRAERVSAWRGLAVFVGGIVLGLVPGYILGGGLGVR